jgi:hypothetical protein
VSPAGATLAYTGVANITYEVDASSSLSDPNGWASIATPTASSAGTFTATDPDAGKYSSRFYRAVPMHGIF